MHIIQREVIIYVQFKFFNYIGKFQKYPFLFVQGKKENVFVRGNYRFKRSVAARVREKFVKLQNFRIPNIFEKNMLFFFPSSCLVNFRFHYLF